ncbi:MAG: D-2-hydroxyacid dehydrogenase [Saprospiraceae bacterium]|nr:D-2-hydroxyacid dehydrogenase [Saprospiraceae bacterium]
MIKILANDGIHPAGQEMLEAAGFQVNTNKIAQEDLMEQLPSYDVVLVRSATKIRESLIDACPNLKIIGRGGVGLDNIDVDYAKGKGIAVYNTPAASSRSVAELVLAHMLTLSRSLHLSNRQMPAQGNTEFKALKKSYAAGSELQGKTLGIIGFGRIGQQTASLGLVMGMKICAVDPFVQEAQIEMALQHGSTVSATIATVSMDEMLSTSDYISLHVPSTERPIISNQEIQKMKNGVIIVNASRGGTIDEDALLQGLQSGKIGGAGLDVFVGEPTPRQELLQHAKISVTPHTGASTGQAQANIGTELAEKIIAYYKNQ